MMAAAWARETVDYRMTFVSKSSSIIPLMRVMAPSGTVEPGAVVLKFGNWSMFCKEDSSVVVGLEKKSRTSEDRT